MNENDKKTDIDAADEETLAEEETVCEKTQESRAETSSDNNEKKSKKEHKAELAELKEKAENLEKQLQEEKDRYLRMLAEYDNYRRRSQKEKEGAYADAYADALKEIVPVIDNLERAVGFGASEKLLDGVNMTLNQFRETLTKLGVESFGQEGDTFDPMMHNAIMHEEDENQPENYVSAVFQKGYRKGDKIIRFAVVKVLN